MQRCALWLRADYKHWPWLVYRQQCMVTLLMFHRLAREHASHLVYNESSSVKSCPSLWTCSVLFQLMSTAGPLARCSEFNERNDLGGIFFFSSFFGARENRALKGNWWLILAFLTLQNQKCNTLCWYDLVLQHFVCQQVTFYESESWELSVKAPKDCGLSYLQEFEELYPWIEPYLILFSCSRP